MSNRYIERYRLPGSRYTKSSPVILAAGALVEDTQSPRLVVQLKFRSISQKPLAGITVTVRSYAADGAELEEKSFAYKGLCVRLGQEFGQFTAIQLPFSGAQSFTAVITRAVFSDGVRWVRTESAAPIPPKVETDAPAKVAIPAEAAVPAPKYAAVEETAPEPVAAAPEKGRHRPRIKPRRIAIATGCVAVVIAAVIFLPKLLKGEPEISAGQPEQTGSTTQSEPPSGQKGAMTEPETVAAINVTTPSDGNAFSFDVAEDEDGRCYVYFDDLLAAFPQISAFTMDGVPNMGNDIDNYLIDSFHFAFLIGWGTEENSDERYSGFNAKTDPSSPRALLLFSDPTTLCGYAIGVPESLGGGVWRFNGTFCNYDFSALYEEQRAAFAAAETPQYIPPQQVADIGAAYYLNAYNMKNRNEEADNAQLFHLWSQYNSLYLDKHARKISTFESRAANSQSERYPFYLFLDEHYEVIGYSVISSADDLEQTALTNITTPSDGERLVLAFQENASGNCSITEDMLRAYFPQMYCFSLIDSPNLGNDLDAYLADTYHMASMAGSDGEFRQKTASLIVKENTRRVQGLFVFSDETTLCAYFVGIPEKADNNLWEIEVTLCDHDISDLVRQKTVAFSSAETPRYIQPEEISTCGAKWFMYAFNMTTNTERTSQIQLFRLWNQYSSPYRDRYLNEMDYFVDRLPDGTSGSTAWRYFYLLDENRELIGYTIISTEDSDGVASELRVP